MESPATGSLSTHLSNILEHEETLQGQCMDMQRISSHPIVNYRVIQMSLIFEKAIASA